MSHTLVEKEHTHMSEVEQEKPREIMLPIDWHVPESIIGRYVHNVIVQPGKHEITIFFFENQIPPFVGTPEAIRDYMLQIGSIRSECIGKMIVDPELMPDIIEALQTGLKNYNEAKATEDREANR
jgi:hypothetical protein